MPQRAKPMPRRLKPRQRKSACQRGYDRRWRDASRRHLAQHPLCAECKRQGRVRHATLVDHVRPHKGRDDLFWDASNWQSLCVECHVAKTARGE